MTRLCRKKKKNVHFGTGNYAPPRTFWRKHDTYGDRYGPHPLNSKWYPICPLILTGNAATINSRSNKLPKDPTPVPHQSPFMILPEFFTCIRKAIFSLGNLHVDKSSQYRPQLYRTNLARILCCKRLKHAPRDPAKNLSNHQRLYVWREKQHEYERSHEKQCANHGLAISIAFGNEAVDHKADDLACTSAVGSMWTG